MKNKLTPEALIQALSKAQSVTIFLASSPDFDQVAAACALFLSFEAYLATHEKQVEVVCPTPMIVEFSSLVGVDRIRQETSGRSLVISLDYQQEAIDRVSYNIEKNKFNLVISPKPGCAPLSGDKVSFSTGGESGVVIALGTRCIDELKKRKEKGELENKEIVSLEIEAVENDLAGIKMVDEKASSFSEMVTIILAEAGYPTSQEIAENLLRGLRRKSANFSSNKVRPETFEAAAFCLRSGASLDSLNQRDLEEKKGRERAATSLLQEKPDQVQDQTPPSSDWLRPKIFQGSTRV